MRTVQPGEIVVVMSPCREGCGMCGPLIGQTAQVVNGNNNMFSTKVSLKFRKVGGNYLGFKRSQLYVTGLSA